MIYLAMLLELLSRTCRTLLPRAPRRLTRLRRALSLVPPESSVIRPVTHVVSTSSKSRRKSSPSIVFMMDVPSPCPPWSGPVTI